MRARQINRVAVRSGAITRPMTLALVADLHNAPYEDVLPALRTSDAILILGDLVNRHRTGYSYAVDFLRDAPRCAPTFYAIGNHEWLFPQRKEYWPLVEKSDVTVLDNRFIDFQGITLGGFSSAPKGSENGSFLAEMAARDGFKLLMCHQPEMYEMYVRPLDIDLTVSGHAHGGQIELFGHGLYSPGQGIFPRLTHGFYDGGRLLVSRGMTNSCGAPRWHNPCELILLSLEKTEA